MNPTELTTPLTAEEQTLFVATEPKRLAEIFEDASARVSRSPSAAAKASAATAKKDSR